MKKQYANYTIKISDQYVFVGKTENFSKIKKLHEEIIKYFYNEFSNILDLSTVSRNFDGLNIKDILYDYYIDYNYINSNFYQKIVKKELEQWSIKKSIRKHMIIAISIIMSESSLSDLKIKIDDTYDTYFDSYSNDIQRYFSLKPWFLANDIKTKWNQTINEDAQSLFKSTHKTEDTIDWYKKIVSNSISVVKEKDYQGYKGNPNNVISDINLWITNNELNTMPKPRKN